MTVTMPTLTMNSTTTDEIDYYDNGKGDLTTKAILRWTAIMMLPIHMMMIIIVILL